MHVELIGGPLCGRAVERQRRPTQWAFVDADLRMWRDSRDDRHFYRELEEKTGRIVYIYAGHSHTRCGGCGVYHQLTTDGAAATRCTICDHELGKAA